MVIQQSAKDAAVLVTFVLVLMIVWKGVTGDNRRRSRKTSLNDNLLELEASREPFGNDEELEGGSLWQELRGTAQSEDVDADSGNQQLQQDRAGLVPEVLEDQLLSEEEDGAGAQQRELETQEYQQPQIDQLTGKEYDEVESQHTQQDSKESLQPQQQLPNEERDQGRAQSLLLDMAESRQLQKVKPVNVDESETSPQRAKQEVEEEQQLQKESPNEENNSFRFRRTGVDPKDEQQLQNKQLTRVEKNTVVLQHAQLETKEGSQLQQEGLPNVMSDTGIQHDPLETRDNHDIQQEMLSKEDNSEVRAQHAAMEMEEANRQLPHVLVSAEKKAKGGAQHSQFVTKQMWEMEGQQSPNQENGGSANRHLKSGTDGNHHLQQKLLQSEEKGSFARYLGKLEAGDILQRHQNQFDSLQRGAVDAQHGQMEAKDIRKLQQDVEKGTVNAQPDVEQQQLQQLAAFGRTADNVHHDQEAGKQLKPDEMPGVWRQPGNVGKVAAVVQRGPFSVDKLHPNGNTAMANSGHVELGASERLATSKQLKPDKKPGIWMQHSNLGKVVDLVHSGSSSVEKLHANEHGAMANSGHVELAASERLATSKQLKPDEMSGVWIQHSNVRKVADLEHSGSSSVEKLHPNEHSAMANSGHVELAASERLATSKQRIQSESPTAVQTDILMPGSETELMHNVHGSEDETRPRERIDSIGWQQPSKVGETDTQYGAQQWLQTPDRKSAVHVQQELPAAGERDRPAGVEMRQRPEGEMPSGAERQRLRKPADGSHRAHKETEKVKNRAKNKATSPEQLRGRRRYKAAATAASKTQRQQLHRVLPRPQRQEGSQQYQPDDVLQAALAASLASSESAAGDLDLGVSLPVAPELATSTTSSVEGEPVGRLAVVLVPSPAEEVVDVPSTVATVPTLEMDTGTITNTITSTITSASTSSTSTSNSTSAEPLLPTSTDSDAVATRVLQGVQRRAQQSERLRQHILPSLRSSPPPTEAAAGGRHAPCNATSPAEAAACQRRQLLDRALGAMQQLRRLEERGQQCPAPPADHRAFLRQLLQFAPGQGAGPGRGELARRIRHLRRLVADYENLTAAEKSQVRGVRDYLARQLSRLYSLTQTSTLPPVDGREVTERQLQFQLQKSPLEGREAAAATALLEALRRHAQLPGRRDAFRRRLQRRLAARPRRDAYAQLAVSAADARFRMPPV